MNQSRPQGEYHRADPAYRRQMIGWLAFTVAAGAVTLYALNRWLHALQSGMGMDAGVTLETWLHRLLGGTCLLLAAAAAAFGLWLRRVAAQTQRERRWPPSGMRTSQDVRIRYLTSADALVAQLNAGGAALLLLAAVLVAWGGWLLWIAR